MLCTASIVEYNVSIANLYPWREGIAELGFNQPVLHIQSLDLLFIIGKRIRSVWHLVGVEGEGKRCCITG